MRPRVSVAMTCFSTKENDTSAYTNLALSSLFKNSRLVDGIVLYDNGPVAFNPYEFTKANTSIPYAIYSTPGGSVNETWSMALWRAHDLFGPDEERFIVITNDDVIFMPDWDLELVRAFEIQDCGISGPVTNQAGHQPLQLVDTDPPSDDLAVFMKMRKMMLGLPDEQRPPITKVPYVNGFCFMLRADRVMDPSVFGTGQYGGEDRYQAMMRANGFSAYVNPKSWVYHFKDVSMETWKVGRMGLDINRLPRIKESKNEETAVLPAVGTAARESGIGEGVDVPGDNGRGTVSDNGGHLGVHRVDSAVGASGDV